MKKLKLATVILLVFSGFSIHPLYAQDTIPPSCLYASPTWGDSAVAINASIIIAFDEAIDTVTSIPILSPDPGSVIWIWNTTLDTVTAIHNDFAYLTTYSAQFGGFGDTSGNWKALICGTTFTTRDSTVTGIAAILNSSKEIKILPNPFSTSATIKISNAKLKIKNAELRIYNLAGKEIMKVENINKQEIIINRDGMTDGIYLYELRDKNRIIGTGKILVE